MCPARMLQLVFAAFTLTACAGIGAGTGPEETAEMAEAKSAAAGTEACGADSRQDWVGQNVAVLNNADLPATARVMFPGAAATSDFQPERLNVTIGTNDSISRVYCG